MGIGLNVAKNSEAGGRRASDHYRDINMKQVRFYHRFTIILPSANLKHKKTNRKGLVFKGYFGRHERI
ncbi:hypothetical protein CPI84_12100 [Erwinia pyrifoliae]|nr:hypothetical protein CPI84_12100 [Erwinia pyrifoliae]